MAFLIAKQFSLSIIYEIVLEQKRRRFIQMTMLQSTIVPGWDHSGTTVGPQWDQSGTSAGAVWLHCDVAVVSTMMCNNIMLPSLQQHYIV